MGKVELQANYQQQFLSFWKSLSRKQKQAVVGFYIKDEPFWVAAEGNTSISNWNETKQKLSTVIKFIKSKVRDRLWL